MLVDRPGKTNARTRDSLALAPQGGLMDLIEEHLSRSKTIAVVGLSPDPDRPSHYVAKYLQEQGFRHLTSWGGLACM